VQDSLLDIYAYEKGLAECSYEMMGKMLDSEFIKRRIRILNTSELYVYGGGYLGIQFYQAANDFVNILAIADRKGKLIFHIPYIPVITYGQLKRKYKGQKIVVASIQYFNEIKEELSAFADPNCIIYLGELLGGLYSALYNLH